MIGQALRAAYDVLGVAIPDLHNSATVTIMVISRGQIAVASSQNNIGLLIAKYIQAPEKVIAVIQNG